MQPIFGDFQTDFRTEAGKTTTNRQYYAFTEQAGLACWIIAEQLDSSEEKESARLAAEQLIQDFSQRPTLSRSKLKAYLANAHRKLVAESKTMNVMLKVGLVMLVSDYSKLVWAVSGNVRLYHFRDGAFNFRSKDQTIAQVMLDAGNITEADLNKRNERTGLINYLGISTEFNPLVAQAFSLHDGDRLLICSIGLWETLTPEALTQALASAEQPAAALEKLQEKLAEQTEKQPKQYIASVVFINQVRAKQLLDYLSPKNIAIVVTLLVIMAIGMLVSNTSQPTTPASGKTTGKVAVSAQKTASPIDKPAKRLETQTTGDPVEPNTLNEVKTPPETATAIPPSEAESLSKQTDAAEQQRQQETESLRKQREAEARQRQQEAESLRKQREAEARQRQQEAESLRKQREAEARQRQQRAAENLRKQREAEARQRQQEADNLRKQREAEERQRQQEADNLRKQREAEERQRQRQQEADNLRKQQEAEERRRPKEAARQEKPQNAGTTSENNNSKATKAPEVNLSQATALEKAGDAKYESQQYAEALDLYKKAKQAYVELGMTQDAARLEKKINTTINKKLEHFLKQRFKK